MTANGRKGSCARNIQAQLDIYCATVVVSVATGVVVVSDSTAGAVVSSCVAGSVAVSDSDFVEQEAAKETIAAARNNLIVFFIDYGLKFPFIQKSRVGNPMFEKYLPWVTFIPKLY